MNWVPLLRVVEDNPGQRDPQFHIRVCDPASVVLTNGAPDTQLDCAIGHFLT